MKKIIKRGKKGFLLAEETLKIIIALIAIGILIYFLVSLYLNHKQNQDLKLAKETLERLKSETDSGVTKTEIYNPIYRQRFPWATYWFLFTWPTGGDSIRPQSCSNVGWDNCVCICGVKSFGVHVSKKDLANMCDNLGVCREFTDLKIKKNNGFFSQGLVYTYDDILALRNPPIELNIDYQKKEITEKL